jgi:hypothetical protein
VQSIDCGKPRLSVSQPSELSEAIIMTADWSRGYEPTEVLNRGDIVEPYDYSMMVSFPDG